MQWHFFSDYTFTTWRAGLSGFCNFGLVSFMGFVIEPWHSRYVLFLCECAASSVLEPCPLSSKCLVSFWSMVFRSQHSCLEFRFVSGFGHSCMFCPVLWACGLEFARLCNLLSTSRACLEGGHGVAPAPHKMCLPPPPRGAPAERDFYRWELRTSIFLGPVHNRTTYKLEDKQYCYRYVRCFISLLLC